MKCMDMCQLPLQRLATPLLTRQDEPDRMSVDRPDLGVRLKQVASRRPHSASTHGEP
jgi:hypothetical protein